jgi:hypothetical protein
MYLTTVGKRGDVLPVGLAPAGGLVRAQDFSFKDWTSTDEVAIGRIRDKERALNQGEFVTRVLAHFLRTWCGVSCEGLDEVSKVLLLKRSTTADVLYAWFRLRQDVLGNSYTMDMSCGNCKHPIPYDIDLGSTEVFVTDPDEDPRWDLDLADGLDWMDEKRKLVTLQPIPWGIQEKVYAGEEGEGTVNLGSMKLSLICGSIVRVEGLEHDVAIPPGRAQFSKRDLELLSSSLVEMNPGLDLIVEVECPKCHLRLRRPVNWVYDSFFSVEAPASSGGRTSTKSGRSALRSRMESKESADSSNPCDPETDTGTSSD